MEGIMNPVSPPLHNAHSHSQIQSYDTNPAGSNHDDFLEQMLSTIPNCSSWSDLSNNPNNKSSWDNSLKSPRDHDVQHQLSSEDQQSLPPTSSAPDGVHFPFDDSVLASKLRQQHPMNGNSSGAAAAAAKSFILQQQLMMARGGGGGLRSPSSGDGDGEANGLLAHLNPLSLGGSGGSGAGNGDSVDSRLLAQGGEGSVQALFNGFSAGGSGSLHGNNGQAPNHQQQQQFHHSPPNFGSPGGTVAAALNQTPASASSGGGTAGNGQAPAQRQRVRARRGQATDPHSIAERLRRERIAERMKALQELVPNANKTDKASMLDEIIDYVKFLQLQVKVLSMSRLGGAGAGNNPLLANMGSEGGRTGNGKQASSNNNKDSTMTVTEHQVAKLMEEDMGSAMQYLQGKGLCLMPISLATAISTATCHPAGRSSSSSSAAAAAAAVGGGNAAALTSLMNGAHAAANGNGNHHQNGSNSSPDNLMVNGEGGPNSPNMSVLIAHSGGAAAADGTVKDGASVSKQ